LENSSRNLFIIFSLDSLSWEVNNFSSLLPSREFHQAILLNPDQFSVGKKENSLFKIAIIGGWDGIQMSTSALLLSTFKLFLSACLFISFSFSYTMTKPSAKNGQVKPRLVFFLGIKITVTTLYFSTSFLFLFLFLVNLHFFSKTTSDLSVHFRHFHSHSHNNNFINFSNFNWNFIYCKKKIKDHFFCKFFLFVGDGCWILLRIYKVNN
jgi:hypothetical protein